MLAKVVVHGVYKDLANVEEVVRALKLDGVENADISVAVADNKDSNNKDPKLASQAQQSSVTDSAVKSGGSGAVVGGALGGLAGISMLAVPFVGPLMAAGSVLAGAGVGGTVGTIVGALKGIGVSENEVTRYEGRLREGGLLVSVRCDSVDQVKRARDLFTKTGASDISAVGEGDAHAPGADDTFPTAASGKLRNTPVPEGVLRNTNDLKGFSIRGIDGEIGTVTQFYFDEGGWAIRYIAVATGDWLGGRLVLISPISIVGEPDWQAKRIEVSLSRGQVENSPFVDTLRPVSRQLECAYLSYYGYPYYWGGSDVWGDVPYPADLAVRPVSVVETPRATTNPADTLLHSTQEISGYGVEAPDGEVGPLDGFVIDDKTWVVRYIVVGTRNWWPGKKVLVSPAWIDRISWAHEKINIEFSRETIKNGPEYTETSPVNREYENRLYSHYGRKPYWVAQSVQSKERPAPSLSPV